MKCYGKTQVLSILSARVGLGGESGKEIDIHAKGKLEVLGVKSGYSAEFDFCGTEFPFYPDGKRFVGFGAVSSSPGSGGMYHFGMDSEKLH